MRRAKLGKGHGLTDRSATEAFETFKTLWNEGKFFEAHEALEALWVKTRDRGQQGLIQLVVALHHVRRGNLRGALTMIERALPRLTDATAAQSPIDLRAAADYAHRLRAAVDAGEGLACVEARPKM